MTLLEWIIMGGTAACILALLITFYCLFQVLRIKKQLKRLPSRPPKNKKKRRRWANRQTVLLGKRKRHFISFVVFLCLGAGFGGGAYYAYFYQSMNLTSDDANAIVQSYYLVQDFQTALEKSANQSEDETASLQDIRYLSTSLASYNTKNASQLNTVEGQSALNRYYAALSELGVNATRESQNFYGNPDLVAQFQTDIERVLTYQATAFDYYKVNQEALAAEKSEGE